MKHWIQTGAVAAGIALAVALLPGCVVKTATDVNIANNASVAGPSTDASPSPSPCTVTSLDLGTEGDAVEIARGGTVKLVIAYRGAQGVELPSSCTANLAPNWTAAGACTLLDSASAPRLKAPGDAVVGATCTASARLGLLESRTITLTVVAQ